MSSRSFYATALLGLMLSQPAHAQFASVSGRQVCSTELLGMVGKSIRLEEAAHGNGGVLAAACKVWPKDEAITLVAIAYRAGADDGLNLAVAMLDNGRNQLIASYTGRLGRQAEMRLGPDSLSIDTARYDVTRGIRAFGVDVTNRVADCSRSGPRRMRNLYVLDGTEIRPIMDGFDLSYQRGQGSLPACPAGVDAASAVAPVMETVTLKIALGQSLTHDYRDLSIFSVSSFSDGSPSSREPFRYELKYDGRQYPLDEMHKAYLEWLR